MAGIRVLVLCADIGEGHLTVARELTAALQRHPDVEAVEMRSDLDVLGPRLGRFLTKGFEVHLDQIKWTYDLAYRIFFQRSLPRRAAHLALATLGHKALRRTISEFGADVVVADYPVLSAALGELRSMGRLATPACSAISDPAGLYYWAHPGIDTHLLLWPQAVSEVERIAGPGRAAVVRPLIDGKFLSPPSRAEARASLSLPQDTPVVVVSGGGWGIGDLAGAARVALAVDPAATVVCLAGHSERAYAELKSALGEDARARVLGFTQQMPALLAAADVLIHTTGGTTAYEARVVGCPLINYGTGPAHARAHARALAERGLAEWAPDRGALSDAIARTLAGPRPEPLRVDGLPDGAELMVRLARSTS